MPAPTSNSSSGPPRRDKSRAIIASLLATFVFLTAVAILYTQWLRSDNPVALILVEGSEALDDAMVMVRPLGGANREPLMAQIKDGLDHRLRFHVPPGFYTVTVSRADRPLLKPMEVQVDARNPIYLGLERPTTRGANAMP